jgi:hypothetical protein
MNTSRHHADWLSLVEVSGPFVSLPVLLRLFPQGLDARDPAQAKALRGPSGTCFRQRLGDVHLSGFTERCGRHNGSYTRPALHRADGRMRESK